MPEWSERTQQALQQAMREQGLPDPFLDSLRRCYLPLAETIAQKKQGLTRPLEVSINGPQGSGKSTLAAFLALLLRQEFGCSTASLSLDDLYLRRAARLELAARIHPLFRTRGVPGTHDQQLAKRVFDALRQGQPVSLPRFDKAADERQPLERWPRIGTAPDVILFEGWCNHCPPQSDEELAEPVNELERAEDPQGIWRRAVNGFLRDYRDSIFRPADLLVYLRIPGFEKVYEWRGLQERKLKQKLGADAGMSEAELRRFIQHYERLTRQGMNSLPALADALVDLDDEHQAVSLLLKRPG